MKSFAIATAIALTIPGAGFCFAADKPVDDNLIGLSTPNGRIAYEFIDLWFNQHKGADAWEKYVSHDNYMNHAVYSASTGKHPTFEEEKAEESRMGTNPALRFDIKQLISQGSLVFAHIHAHSSPDNPGRELVMILRIRDGKITDHWDLHEALKEDSVVFSGLDR